MTHVLDRLHEDHEKVSKLIGKLINSGDGAEKTRQDLCQEIKNELQAHTEFEEEVFYPAVREQSKRAEQQVSQAIEDHEEVERLLQQIEKADPTSSDFSDLINELEGSIEAHVRREEDDIFPMARELLDEQESEQMGQRHDSMVAEHMRIGHS